MPNGKTEAENKELQKTENGQILTKKESEFQPTKKMLKWFITTQELGYTASITEISEASKVTRAIWYEWCQNDDFVKWWDAQWQKNLHQNRWKLDAIGLKQAKNSYSYWKDMMNRVGNTIPEPGSIGQQFNTQLNIQDDYFQRITRRG